MSVFKNNKSGSVTDISFTENMMTIAFDTGREILIPLEWYPDLQDATLCAERRRVRGPNHCRILVRRPRVRDEAEPGR